MPTDVIIIIIITSIIALQLSGALIVLFDAALSWLNGSEPFDIAGAFHAAHILI